MPSFRPHSGPAQGGFTLLEVLVALSIIAIVMVSALRLQGQSISLNETTRFYSLAPFLAQSKMAEVHADPSAFAGGGAGEFDEGFAGYKWEVGIEERDIGLKGESTAKIDAITVTVRLDPAGLRYSLFGYYHNSTGDSN